MEYVDEIFLSACDIPDPRDRASYLWDACCGDTDFLVRVMAKLGQATGSIPSSLVGETGGSGREPNR